MMDQLKRMQELNETHEAAKFQFINTELDLAFTYLGVATTTDDTEKAERNMEHAKQAYAAAMRFLEGAALSPQMHQEISEKLERLGVLGPVRGTMTGEQPVNRNGFSRFG